MLCVDIKSAFASTIRELVLPPAMDDEPRVSAILVRRGFPPTEAAAIVEEATHAQLWGNTCPHLRHLVGALSTHQHVMMNFLSGVLKIDIGLPAGLSLADLCFTIAV